MSYFQAEVKEQGRALRAAAESYREQDAHPFREAARLLSGRPILFTGMGSSWAAALAAESYLVRGGRLAVAVDASEALYRWLPVLRDSRGLAPVLISQSGESQELVRLAGRLTTPFVAITNNLRSTLAQKAAVALPLHGGVEQGVTNKTFINSVAVAVLLGRTLLAERSPEKLSEMARLLEIAEFQEAAAAVDVLLGAGQAVESLYREFTAGEAEAGRQAGAGGEPLLESWDLIGRGSGLAAVQQGALTIRELTTRTVAPFGGGLYRHGPVYRSGPRSRAIILASRDEEGQLLGGLARDILDRGGRVAFISDFDPGIESERLSRLDLPPLAPGLFPITSTVPLQLLAIADAAARGFEPGLGVPKVTPVE